MQSLRRFLVDDSVLAPNSRYQEWVRNVGMVGAGAVEHRSRLIRDPAFDFYDDKAACRALYSLAKLREVCADFDRLSRRWSQLNVGESFRGTDLGVPA